MKRLLAASALSAAVAISAAPAFAAGTPSYGSVKLNWSVNTTASMQIVTEYSTSFVQGTAAPALQPSPAGTCGTGVTGAPTAETPFNIDFGPINPSLSAAVACNYQNAVAVKVTTNDSSGFTVKQYLDAAPAAGVGFCAFPNNGTTASATLNASAQGTAPVPATYAGTTLTTCATGGTMVPVATGGTDSAGTTPGNPNTAGLEYYSNATNGLAFTSLATAAVTPVYAGEDLQLNLAPGTASAAAQTAYVTLVLTPN